MVSKWLLSASCIGFAAAARRFDGLHSLLTSRTRYFNFAAIQFGTDPLPGAGIYDRWKKPAKAKCAGKRGLHSAGSDYSSSGQKSGRGRR